jgi:RNA polymerase sigma-70 factor (ECF subfamily)
MMTNTSDDPALIEKARRDPEAFAVLYRRHLTPVYRYLYSRLGSVHDAEDITTQVFIDALEGLSANRYRAGGCFSAWLFTIARRRLVDFYRQRPTLPLDPTRTGADLCEIPSAEPGLLVALEKSDDLKHLTHLLAQLDEEKQELLRLRFSAGLSFSEIALLENRSEAAVKMALYRTLDWLREHWEAENG